MSDGGPTDLAPAIAPRDRRVLTKTIWGL